ncbi:MAG: antitoxin component YwqK of YwqJK toxin-antitoxin module, partial [Verrucomicrobiales bacterium]
MHRFTLAAVALLVLSSPLPAQETWVFDHGSDELTVAADGSVQLGADSLSFALGGNGTVSVVGEGIDFSVSAGRDLMIGRTGAPEESHLRVITKRPASLTAAELAGTWVYQEFEIEEGASGPTLHGFATSKLDIGVQAGGAIQIGGAPAGTFTIDANRHVLVTIDGETIDFGVTAAKDIMISTSSEAGFHYFRLMMRPESGGVTSQLAGPWSIAAFAVNDSEFSFEAADFAVASNGTFTFPGESVPLALAADGSGGVTVTDDGETFDLVWSQSHDLLALANTIDSEHEIILLVRRPATLTLAELAGTWDLHQLTIENPNFSETVAEYYYPDGKLQERFGYVESDTEDRLHNGLATTYSQISGLPESDTNWTADVMANTSVQNGLAHFFAFDGTTVIRTELYLDDILDGQPAVQGWDDDGYLTLSENWTAGVITQRIQRVFNGPGEPEPISVTTSTFTAGLLTSQLIQNYYSGTANLESVSDLTYTGLVVTRNETTTYQVDGVTKASENLTIFTPAGVLTEQSSTQYLPDGIGLISTNLASFNPDASPITSINTAYHPDGSTVKSRTTSTYPEGTRTVLNESYYPDGVQKSESTGVDGKLHGIWTTWHPNG